jgi:hypothetical protein
MYDTIQCTNVAGLLPVRPNNGTSLDVRFGNRHNMDGRPNPAPSVRTFTFAKETR